MLVDLYFNRLLISLCVLLIQFLTRDFIPPKPDPAPLLHICKEWGVHPRNVVMVGDHLHDIQCGKEAGSGKDSGGH